MIWRMYKFVVRLGNILKHIKLLEILMGDLRNMENKSGCGKMFGWVNINGKKVPISCKKGQLCPSCSTLAEEHRKCSNQSPTINGAKDKPVDTTNRNEAGTQSPSDRGDGLNSDNIHSPLDDTYTFNLSDLLGEDLLMASNFK